METEQSWHTTKYNDQGNTCAQDTFYYCSELYNPKKSFSNLYTDYADCVINKTLSDCGHEFSTSGPNQWAGGDNPYHTALQEDFKHLEEEIEALENYDPSVGYDPEALLEYWKQKHPNYIYPEDPEEEEEDDTSESKSTLPKMTAQIYLIIAVVLAGLLILSPEKNKK